MIEFEYDEAGNLVRGSIRRSKVLDGSGDAAPEQFQDKRTAVIDAAADFINDATRDLPPDVFAAALQAAIARRD